MNVNCKSILLKPSEKSDFNQHLEELLSLNVHEVRQWQAQRFDEIAGTKGGEIILFGAGPLGRRTLAGLRQSGKEPLAFVDNNEQLWQSSVHGVRVVSPAEGARLWGQSATFVVTIYNASERIKQLRALGCAKVLSFAYLLSRYADWLLPHGCLEDPAGLLEQATEIRRAFVLFTTEADRAAYIAQLRWRLFFDFDEDGAAPVAAETRDCEYFPPGLYRFRDDEVFVDCGAFTGDTVRRFMKYHGPVFRRIFTAEPDAHNREHLHKYVEQLPDAVKTRVIVLPITVGAAAGKARFALTASVGSAVRSDGEIEVDVDALDNALGDELPTLIKMDTEGYELEALTGSRNKIAAGRPVLAITVYHRQDHLWRVPLLIDSIAPGYAFFLRNHAEACWDVSCYAVPSDRLLRPPS